VYWYQVKYYGWALYLPDIHCVYILDNGSRGRRTVGLGVALHIEAGVQDQWLLLLRRPYKARANERGLATFCPDAAVPVGYTYMT
jgi:hypothetical protein